MEDETEDDERRKREEAIQELRDMIEPVVRPLMNGISFIWSLLLGLLLPFIILKYLLKFFT